MADSTYLKYTVEPFVVDWVSKRLGIGLRRKKVVVGPRTDGTQVEFEFDGVSDEGQVGLLVSTSQTAKGGAMKKLFMDATLLIRVPFKQKVMAFVSEGTRDRFLAKCDGLLPLSMIEMVVCDSLPQEMKDRIAAFQATAKAEVGDKGKRRKPGGGRR